MSDEQVVYFHIGIGKTGSSYIQSSLACAFDKLQSEDIYYPINEGETKRAAKGHVSSGNFRLQAGLEASIKEFPKIMQSPKVLFSNETIHLALSTPGRKFNHQIRQAFPNARLEFLCYIRDPVDHAVSVYQQAVKRGGYTGTCGEFLRTYDRPPKLLDVARAVREIEGRLTIYNYSRHKKELLTTVETWLGLPEGKLPKPPVKQINRSLTFGELELQRAFNRYLGLDSSRVISNPLCNFLPDIKSENPFMSRPDLVEFLARMNVMVSNSGLRDLIPSAEYYHIGNVEEYVDRFSRPEETEYLMFSPDQIDVLARTVSNALSSGQMDAFFRSKQKL